MDNKKPKIGKKGAARRITEELAKIRKMPLSKDIFKIVDEAEVRTPFKKIAAEK